MTIFISLLSSALLKYDPQTLADSSNIDILLTLLAALTIALPVIESIVRFANRALGIGPTASTVIHKVSLLLSPKGARRDSSNLASQDRNLAGSDVSAHAEVLAPSRSGSETERGDRTPSDKESPGRKVLAAGSCDAIPEGAAEMGRGPLDA